MSYELRLFSVGAAAVIDTALLLSICERGNRRQTAMPIVTLTIGVWLFHGGEFANLLLLPTMGEWAEAARWAAMSTMSVGLLLMPSAMLHGVIRVTHSGFASDTPTGRAILCSYLPLLTIPLVMVALANHPGEAFLDRVTSFHLPYIAFAGVVNTAAIFVFHRQRDASSSRELRRFLMVMELILAILTGLLIFAFTVVDTSWRAQDSPLIFAIILLPVAPSVLFTYFVIRYRFMRLVVERTLVYGVILAAALLFHHLALQRFAEPLADQLRIDLGILEGIIVCLLVVLYQPFRQRVAEALHGLMGRNRIDVRQRTRALAVEMWQHVNDEPETLVQWFATSIKSSFQLKSASAWLFNDTNSPFAEFCNQEAIPAATIAQLHQALESHSHVACRGPSTSNQAAVEILTELNASLAVRVAHEGVSGLLLLGRGQRAKELSEDETHAILLLVELFAATLHNHYLQKQQIIAERRAAQNERLSTLGLLTGCLTHEIKNPLSSIKTIATLLAERCGADDERAEDLQLILEEVDRLAATTTQFLKFARPAISSDDATDIVTVIQGVIHVLSHLARKHNVEVELNAVEDVPKIACPEDNLRQIFFNLVLNAIEAAPPHGHVRIDFAHPTNWLVATICDDGAGIAADLREHIFDAFVTSKANGTGLGLYVVRQNLEDIGGTIECQSEPAGGTCFTIKLPLDKLRCEHTHQTPDMPAPDRPAPDRPTPDRPTPSR